MKESNSELKGKIEVKTKEYEKLKDENKRKEKSLDDKLTNANCILTLKIILL